MSGNTTSGRAKVYRLNAAGGWDDLGAGELCTDGQRISVIADTRLAIFEDIVEADDEISQKDKIISLAKASRDEEFAFSFFSKDCCDAVFKELEIGRRQPSALTASEFSALTAAGTLPLASAASTAPSAPPPGSRLAEGVSGWLEETLTGAPPTSADAALQFEVAAPVAVSVLSSQKRPWPHALRPHGDRLEEDDDSDEDIIVAAREGAPLANASSVALTAEEGEARVAASGGPAASLGSAKGKGQPIPVPALPSHKSPSSQAADAGSLVGTGRAAIDTFHSLASAVPALGSSDLVTSAERGFAAGGSGAEGRTPLSEGKEELELAETGEGLPYSRPPPSALRMPPQLPLSAVFGHHQDVHLEAAGQAEADDAEAEEEDDEEDAIDAALDLRNALKASADADEHCSDSASQEEQAVALHNMADVTHQDRIADSNFNDRHNDGDDQDDDGAADGLGVLLGGAGQRVAAIDMGIGMGMRVDSDVGVDYGSEEAADEEGDAAASEVPGSALAANASGSGLSALARISQIGQSGPGRPTTASSPSLSLRGRGGARRQPLHLGLRSSNHAAAPDTLQAAASLLTGRGAALPVLHVRKVTAEASSVSARGSADESSLATLPPLRRLARFSVRAAEAQQVAGLLHRIESERRKRHGKAAVSAGDSGGTSPSPNQDAEVQAEDALEASLSTFVSLAPRPAQLLEALEAALNAMDDVELQGAAGEDGDAGSGAGSASSSSSSLSSSSTSDLEEDEVDRERFSGPITPELLVRVLLDKEEALVKALRDAFIEAEVAGDDATLTAFGRVVPRLIALCEPELIDALADDQRFGMTVGAFECKFFRLTGLYTALSDRLLRPIIATLTCATLLP